MAKAKTENKGTTAKGPDPKVAAAKAAEAKAAAKPAAPAAAAKAAAPAAAKPAAPKHAKPVAPETVAEPRAHGFRRKLLGRVTSNKMAKTVVVEVIRNALDPVYKKYVRMRDRYKAHDETNQYNVGDRVEIQEHRPISRDKRWIVTRLVTRAVGE